MDLIALLCIVVALALIGLLVWWARRENARLNAKAVETFTSPVDDPEAQAGRPIWRPGERQ